MNIDFNDVDNNLKKLDTLPNGALALILMALALNRTAPISARTLAMVAANRLKSLEEITIPEGGKLILLGSLAPATISHSLGLYEESEKGCNHFDGVEAPSNDQVAMLARLIDASDVYVVVRDFKAFDEAEEFLEQIEGANQTAPSDIPEDPQAVHVGTPLAPSPTPISEDRFARLFPFPDVTEAVPEPVQGQVINSRTAAALEALFKAADAHGVPREAALSQLDEACSFMGEILELARS